MINCDESEEHQPASVHLNDRRLKVLRRVGEGGYSYVYLVEQLKSAHQVENGNMHSCEEEDDENSRRYLFALKRILIQSEETKEMFSAEVRNLGLLPDHMNIIRLLDSQIKFDDKKGGSVGYLLFPFYKNGTVQDRMQKLQASSMQMPLTDVHKLFIGICNGLDALHSLSPPMAFRDLKPANILISKSEEAVLMDFGSVCEARVVVASRKQALAIQEQAEQHVTAPYRPPELFEVASHGELHEKSDIWSLGCCLYAMVCLEPPFDGTATSALSAVLPWKGSGASQAFVQNLANSMCSLEMMSRPSAKELLKMEWK